MKQLLSTLLIFAGSVLALNHLSAQNSATRPHYGIEHSLSTLDAELNAVRTTLRGAHTRNKRAAVSSPKKAVAAEIDRINAQLRSIRAMLHATMRKSLGGRT